MNIEIKDFALTGQFGPITIGDSKERIISLLGTPSNEASLGDNGTTIFYGSYEFFIDTNNALYAIQNDGLLNTWENNSKILPAFEFYNKHITIIPWLIKNNKLLTYRDVLSELKKSSFNYKEVTYYERHSIHLPSRFVIDFEEETKDLMKKTVSAYLFWPSH